MNSRLIMIAVGIAAILGVVGFIYWEGKSSGQSEVRTQVQTETIHQLDEARKDKDKAHEKVTATPYDDRVDLLR